MARVKSYYHDDICRQSAAEEGEYENAWVEALAAFYKADGSTMRADTLLKGWRGLDNIDVRTIEALQAAMRLAPVM